MRKNKVIAWSLLAAMAISLKPVSVQAYGETSQSSTLISDTQQVSDYQTWKENVWTGKESADSSKIVLTPGATEKDLNFCWYSEEKGSPAVKVGQKEDLSDAVVYEGTAIDRSNWKNTYKASNKVSITGVFEENTTYYYSYTDDTATGEWSEAVAYETKATDSYKVLLAGDPQTGASGSTGQGTDDDINIAVDTYNWNKTLETARENDSDASFILSVGDQIDYSNTDDADTQNVRESEYAGFLYPSYLRSIPLATSIGNHESKGTDYQYHYNNPNSEDNLGATNSGSDYYFSYGDVLYIILNSNNRNTAEHTELMEKAVASHPDAKWKIVAFHHDIYGSGQPHSDTDGANLRILFAPLMDKFDIDICLTGHDHSYARTYQMIDGTAIDYGDSVAVDPDGTLYIAAGSASGSKFYNLATTKQYYVAERSNTQLPTYSTLNITDSTLTIKTYDYNGNKYADDFTIVKDADRITEKATVQSLLSEAEAKEESDYTEESWARLQSAITAMKEAVSFTEEDTGAATLVDAYDSSLSTDNDSDPLTYYAYAATAYQDTIAGSNKLARGFSTLLDKTTLESLEITLSSKTYEAAYAELEASIAQLETVQSEANTGSTDGTTSDSSATNSSSSSNASSSTSDDTVITIESDDTVTPTLTIKKGNKKLKKSTTVSLKQGKSFKIKTTVKNSTETVTYKSSNKKSVKVNKNGKVTAKKYTGKKVKITVKCGSLKKTFKVKVTKK